MGCFNVAGTMSNLSIDAGDKVVFIPLRKQYYSANKDTLPIGAETMFVSNDGANMFYSPFCLPIVGEYNDYGSVENIVRDKNVEYLENYFGISIDNFMEQITRNWCGDDDIKCKTPELTEELRSLAGMFESYDVYQSMVEHFKQENEAYKESDLSVANLELLGFKLEENKQTGDDRYKHYYSFPDTEKFAVYSDKRWVKVMNMETKEEIHHIYRIDSLAEQLKNNGYDLKNTEQFKNVTATELSLKNVCKNIKELNSKKAEILEKIKIIKSGNSSEEDTSDLFYELTRIDFKYETVFETLYILKKWRDLKYTLDDLESFLNPLVDLINFNHAMFSTNNYFFPAMNGEQHGNEEASKVLYEACLKITNDKLEERDY